MASKVYGVLIMVLLCASLAQASSFNISNYLKENETAYFLNATDTKKLVLVNFLLSFVYDNETDSLVTDKETIKETLLEYYLKNYYPDEEDTQLFEGNMMIFNQSREPKEGQCTMYCGVGITGFDCTLENSCESCRAMPLCADYMAHVSTFMYSVIDFVNLKKALDANVTIYLDTIRSVQRNEEAPVKFAQAKESLQSIISTKNSILLNKLIYRCDDCYDYCYEIPYNESALSELSSKLNSLVNDLSPINELESTSETVKNKTEERILLKQIRDGKNKLSENLTSAGLKYKNVSDVYTYLKKYVNVSGYDMLVLTMKNDLDDANASTEGGNLTRAEYYIDDFWKLAVSNKTLELYEIYDNYKRMELLESQFETNMLINKVEITAGDKHLLAKADGLEKEKLAMEQEKLSQKIAPQEICNVQKSYESLIEKTASLKSEIDGQSARKTSSVAAFVLSLFSGTGDPMLSFTIALGILCLLAFLGCIGIFLYFVKKGTIYLDRNAKIAWAFVFLVMFSIIVFAGVGVRNAAEKSQTSTFSAFLEKNQGKEMVVYVNLENAYGTTREKMISCGNLTSKELNAKMVYLSYPQQLEEEKNPYVLLKAADKVDFSFYTLKENKAVFEGDSVFYSDCMVAKLFQGG